MKIKTIKIMGVLLTLAILVSAFALVVSAESSGVTVTIDTGASVTLKDADDDGYYEIGTADELYAYAASINNGQTFNAELTADIVVNPGTFDENGSYTAKGVESVREWKPIGTISKPYNSNLDGRNYTISGLFTKVDASYVGLLGYVGVGTVQNVGVIDSYFWGNEYVGSIAGFNGGNIINCYNAKGVADGYVGGQNYVGGLVGVNEKNIINCYNANNVSGTNYIGGMVGQTRKGDPYLDSCHNFGTVSGTGNYIGGVVGSENGGTVQHCSNAGDVGGKIYVGGVTGGNYGTFKNCYNIGTVTGSGNFVGGVVGSNGNAIQDCYYLSDSETDEIDGTTFKTAEQFESGEVCRSIGYHILNESCVCTVCYALDHNYENGFCYKCDAYESATDADSNGYYEIDNAGKLYWFAQQVNGGETDINAELTADITVNEDVLTADGELNGDSTAVSAFRQWIPIGNSNEEYRGTFDGKNHSINGLYLDADIRSIGVFGYVYSGTVRNLNLRGSYLKTNVDSNSALYGGGIVGCTNFATVYHCSSDSIVSVISNHESINPCVGGIVGNAGISTSIELCYHSGAVSVTSGTNQYSYAGGIVGISGMDVIINNCYHTGSASAVNSQTNTNSVAGGIVGSSICSVINCYSTGTVICQGTLGSVIGEDISNIMDEDTKVENNYYLADTETDSIDGTTAKTSHAFASGEVAYKLGEAWGQNIDNNKENEGYPVLGGERVYQNQIAGCTEATFEYEYSNEQKGAISTHADENHDHICDRACGKEDMNMDQHVDGDDTDHLCDYGCEQIVDDGCHDVNTDIDHKCDECGAENIAEHTDSATDKDHVCDNGCGAVLETCTPNADDGDCTTAITCSVCGDVTTEGAEAHTGGTATCEHKAECTVCGKEYGQLADHTYIDGKCECGETDPNCTPGTDKPGTDVPGTDEPETDDPEAPNDGLSSGAIAGIVTGSLVVLGGGSFALWWFAFRKKRII